MINSEGPILSALSFRTTQRPTRASAQTPRQVFLNFIELQMALVEADRDGRDLRVTRERYAKDEAGRPLKKAVLVKPRRAYWNADGEWLVECRHGNVPIEFVPGQPTIFGGRTLDELAQTLATLRRAAENGEVDDAISAAVEKARRKTA